MKERDMNDTIPEWEQDQTGYTTHRTKYKEAEIQITSYIDGSVNWHVRCGRTQGGSQPYSSGNAETVEDAKITCEVARRLLMALSWLSGPDAPRSQEEAAEILEPLFTAVRTRKYEGT